MKVIMFLRNYVIYSKTINAPNRNIIGRNIYLRIPGASNILMSNGYAAERYKWTVCWASDTQIRIIRNASLGKGSTIKIYLGRSKESAKYFKTVSF